MIVNIRVINLHFRDILRDRELHSIVGYYGLHAGEGCLVMELSWLSLVVGPLDLLKFLLFICPHICLSSLVNQNYLNWSYCHSDFVFLFSLAPTPVKLPLAPSVPTSRLCKCAVPPAAYRASLALHHF